MVSRGHQVKLQSITRERPESDQSLKPSDAAAYDEHPERSSVT